MVRLQLKRRIEFYEKGLDDGEAHSIVERNLSGTPSSTPLSSTCSKGEFVGQG